MSVKLSAAALARLPAGVAAPKYRRSDLRAGIVHIGVGNFHRAHQAVYLDDLFNAGRDHDWAIVGAGVRDPDVTIREKLKEQDWLTTVVEQEADTTNIRVTGSMIDFVRSPTISAAFLDAISEPSIRIVSLTVTEGGYYISPATQHFDPAHPDIVYDAQHAEAPKTAFGLIAAGLKRRRAAGTAPFTVMSCDNIPGNGHVTENAVAGLAELADPELARWIRANVAFPNSMVDRITPATTDRERAILRDKCGLEDNWPVFCEEFRQWVVEDKFPAGRPALETVGVTFTSDVSPYELMKIRILNGGHAAIAYPAGLLDIHFVHEAMADEQIRAFLEKLTKSEIQPVVPPPPNTSLDDYRELIARRFANPKIGDTIQRLCFDGSNRQPKFILPDRRRSSESGRVLPGSGARVGSLVPLLLRRDRERQADRAERSQLGAAARRRRSRRATTRRPSSNCATSSASCRSNPAYVRAFSDALSALWARGVRSTLADYLSDKS